MTYVNYLKKKLSKNHPVGEPGVAYGGGGRDMYMCMGNLID